MFDFDGNPEILDRIKMLANFYSGALILKYEYPMMVVTKSKDIFIRRLRRYKKILTEEGSSDESVSNQMSRTIELHVENFLDSVNSSELSKKTHQLRKDEHEARMLMLGDDDLLGTDSLLRNGLLQGNREISFESSIHNIHSPSQQKCLTSEPQDTEGNSGLLSEDESFANKLLRLSKRVTLNEMTPQEVVEINLNVESEEELSHLVWDFEEIDVEQTVKNYQKILQRGDNSEILLPRNTQQANGFHKKPKYAANQRIGLPNQPQHHQIDDIFQIRKFRGSFDRDATVNSNHRPGMPHSMKQSAMDHIRSPYKDIQSQMNGVGQPNGKPVGKRSAFYANDRSRQFYEDEGYYQTAQNSSARFWEKSMMHYQSNEERRKVNGLRSNNNERVPLQRHKSDRRLLRQSNHLQGENPWREVPEGYDNRYEEQQFTHKRVIRSPKPWNERAQMDFRRKENNFMQGGYDVPINKKQIVSIHASPSHKPLQQNAANRPQYYSPELRSKNSELNHGAHFSSKYSAHNRQQQGREIFSKKAFSGHQQRYTEYGQNQNIRKAEESANNSQWRDMEKVEKKQKLRQKAAQLLNRVKSQEYLNRMGSPGGSKNRLHQYQYSRRGQQ